MPEYNNKTIILKNFNVMKRSTIPLVKTFGRAALSNVRMNLLASHSRMLFSIVMMSMMICQNVWAAGDLNGMTLTFDFTSHTNYAVNGINDHNVTGTNRTHAVQMMSDPYYDGYIALQPSDWTSSNGMKNNKNGVRYLSIKNIFAGDKLTVIFEGSNGITWIDGQNALTSNYEYTISGDQGYVDLEVKAYTVIKQIKITYQTSRIIWGGSPAGTKDGMPYYNYRLSTPSRDFQEPPFTIVPSGPWFTSATVENYGTQIEGKTVAIWDADNLDVMCINEGWAKVTVNFSNGQSSSYLVNVWDNEAYSEVTEIKDANDDVIGNRFQFVKDPGIANDNDQGGVLKHRVVTAVEGLEVRFGIPRLDNNDDSNADDHYQPNTTVVQRNTQYGEHYVAFTNADNGWWDRSPYYYTEARQGTFFGFKATAEGWLKFGGLKMDTNNRVYIIHTNEDGANLGDITIFPDGTTAGYVEYTGNDGKGLHLNPGDIYYVHGEADRDANKWCMFLLEWFSFEIEGGGIKLSKPYGVSDKTGFEIGENGTITDTETIMNIGPGESMQIIGYKGTIKSASVEKVKLSGGPGTGQQEKNGFKFTNIKFNANADGKMGGAIKVRLSNNKFYRDYVFTIPYGKHVWDFRNTTTDSYHANGGDEVSFTAEGMAEDVKGNTDDLSRVYKVHSKPSGTFESLIDPLLVARGKVNGTNAFYLSNTSGLMMFANGESFGTQEKANTNGSTYTSYHGLDGIDDDVEYTYPYTTVTAADMMWLKGQRHAGNMNSDEVMDTKILFPGVKPNQYIKIYMHRHSDNKGEVFTAENLMDLAGQAIDNTKTFIMHGSQFYRDVRGAIIFRVPEDYVPTQDVSQIPALVMKDDGWAYFMRIEICDDYTTDQRSHIYEMTIDGTKLFTGAESGALSNSDPGKELVPTSGNNSVVYESSASVRLDGTASKTYQQNAWSPQYKVENVGNSNVQFSTELVPRKPRNAWYTDLQINITGGTGNLRIIQEMKSGDYILDRSESYLAVNQYHTQQYPYTWDFTARNMNDPWTGDRQKSTDADATTPSARINGTSANNAAQDYGRWESGKLMNYCGQEYVAGYSINHYQDVEKPNDNPLVSFTATNAQLYDSYDATATTHPIAEVIRPIFADGGELTYGVTPLNETKGLRFSLPLPGVDEDAVSDDIRTSGKYAAYNGTLELTCDGLKLTKCSAINAVSGNRTTPTVTINKVKNMYVFVDATSEPIATADGESLEEDETYLAPDGVYIYKVEGNNAKDVSISFNANTTIHKIGVTDIEKGINKYGYATESRDRTIDHFYTGEFTSNAVKAYLMKNYDGTKVTMVEAEVVPEETGIVLYKKNTSAQFDAPLFVNACNVGPDDTDGNLLKPNVESSTLGMTDGNGNTNFVLTDISYYIKDMESRPWSGEEKIGFYRVGKSGTLSENKSYLQLPTADLNTTYGAKGVVFISWSDEEFQGTPTDIYNVSTLKNEEQGDWYMLDGRKLQSAPIQKGIYLKNGKKILVK